MYPDGVAVHHLKEAIILLWPPAMAVFNVSCNAGLVVE